MTLQHFDNDEYVSWQNILSQYYEISWQNITLCYDPMLS